jgi:hypothetical protein
VSFAWMLAAAGYLTSTLEAEEGYLESALKNRLHHILKL